MEIQVICAGLKIVVLICTDAYKAFLIDQLADIVLVSEILDNGCNPKPV